MVNYGSSLGISTIIWLPLLGALVVPLIKQRYAGCFYSAITKINAIVIVLLYANFSPNVVGFQYTASYNLFAKQGIIYAVGVDGLALLLLGIVNFVSVWLPGIIGKNSENHEIYTKLLSINGLINGVLSATNVLMLYIFYELVLLPVGLLLRPDSNQSQKKFFCSVAANIASSILFMVAIIYLYQLGVAVGVESSKLLDISALYRLSCNFHQQTWLAISFALAIVTKISMLLPYNSLSLVNYSYRVKSIIAVIISVPLTIVMLLRFWLPISPLILVAYGKAIVVAITTCLLYLSIKLILEQQLHKFIASLVIIGKGNIIVGIILFAWLANSGQQLDIALMGINGAILQALSLSLTALSWWLLAPQWYSIGDNLVRWLGIGYFLLPLNISFISKFMLICASYKQQSFVAGLLALIFIIPPILLCKHYCLFAATMASHARNSAGDSALGYNLFGLQRFVIIMTIVAMIGLGIYSKPVTALVATSADALISTVYQHS